MMKLAISLLPLLLLMPAREVPVQSHELSRDEAIQFAETVIVKNGCTDLTPPGDRRQLLSEQANVDFAFRLKHEVYCKAIHARAGKVNGKSSWIIGFPLSHGCPECTRFRERLVLMNRDGSNLRLETRESRIKKILKTNR